MTNIIYFGVMFIISVIGFVLGKFIFPNIPVTDIEIMEKWATRVVHFCRQFLDGREGQEKMAKAIELLQNIQKKYKINLTEEELKAIAQYAYDMMKLEKDSNV